MYAGTGVAVTATARSGRVPTDTVVEAVLSAGVASNRSDRAVAVIVNVPSALAGSFTVIFAVPLTGRVPRLPVYAPGVQLPWSLVRLVAGFRASGAVIARVAFGAVLGPRLVTVTVAVVTLSLVGELMGSDAGSTLIVVARSAAGWNAGWSSAPSPSKISKRDEPLTSVRQIAERSPSVGWNRLGSVGSSGVSVTRPSGPSMKYGVPANAMVVPSGAYAGSPTAPKSEPAFRMTLAPDPFRFMVISAEE